MSSRKVLVLLLVVLMMGLAIIAEAQDKLVIFVSRQTDTYLDPTWGDYADYPFTMILEEQGYDVLIWYDENLSAANQATFDLLNSADLIIMGRSTPSTMYQDPNKEAWNSLTAPIMNIELWNCRSSRLNWFNSTAMANIDDYVDYNAIIDLPDDPVFAGIDVSGEVPWTFGPISVLQETEAGNGTVLARMADDLSVLFVRFEPGVEFFEGSGDIPAGHRTMIGNGNDDLRGPSGELIFNYYNFTTESEQVFLNEVARMVNLNSSDVEDNHSKNPNDYALNQNYPNPFNPSTTIEFALPKSGNVTLDVYNLVGEKVATLVDGSMSEGTHTVTWNSRDDSGRPVSNGIYLCKIQAGTYKNVIRMALIK
ncbi:T9SS type A sorting domain-containing protein [bacterium]|nr:T9SS type A sorting domain-containing protein [bacterium]